MENPSKPIKCGRRRHAAINGSDAASETAIQFTSLPPGREGRALFSVASSLDRSGRVRPPRCARVVAHSSPPLSTPFSRLRIGRLGLLALILTVAAVQTVGATIMPGCFGNRGLSCRGTNSSNPSPSSRESRANLTSTIDFGLWSRDRMLNQTLPGVRQG